MLKYDEEEEIYEKVLKLKKCNRKLNKLLKKMKKIISQSSKLKIIKKQNLLTIETFLFKRK